MCFFFFKQKRAYEMRISDWSSDVCSSDLLHGRKAGLQEALRRPGHGGGVAQRSRRGVERHPVGTAADQPPDRLPPALADQSHQRGVEAPVGALVDGQVVEERVVECEVPARATPGSTGDAEGRKEEDV